MSYFENTNVSNLLNPHPVTVASFSTIADSLRYLPILDVVHYKIHQGEMFHTFAYFQSVADSDTAEMLIHTPSEKEMHVGMFINAGGSCTITVFDTPTITGNGTPTLIHNFNTVEPKITSAMTYHTPVTTSDGLKLSEGCVIASGIGTGMVGGSPSFRNEFVLKADSWYMIRLENVSGGAKDYGIELNWYEQPIEGKSSSSSSSSSSSTRGRSTSSGGVSSTSISSYSSRWSASSPSSKSSSSSKSSTSSGTSQSTTSRSSDSSALISFTSISSSSSTVNRSTSSPSSNSSSSSSSSSSTVGKSTSSRSSSSSSLRLTSSSTSQGLTSDSSSSRGQSVEDSSSSSSSSRGFSSSSVNSSSSSSGDDYGGFGLPAMDLYDGEV